MLNSSLNITSIKKDIRFGYLSTMLLIVVKHIEILTQKQFKTRNVKTFKQVSSMVEWLKHWTDDQHDPGSKPTCAILLCPWKRHFTALSPAWWSWQAVLNYSNIATKLLADSNILASLEAGRGNCLPYV